MTTPSRHKNPNTATLLWNIFGALVGVAAAWLIAPTVLSLFDGSPAWVAPVAIIGTLAVCLVLFMLVPQWLRGRKR